MTAVHGSFLIGQIRYTAQSYSAICYLHRFSHFLYSFIDTTQFSDQSVASQSGNLKQCRVNMNTCMEYGQLTSMHFEGNDYSLSANDNVPAIKMIISIHSLEDAYAVL